MTREEAINVLKEIIDESWIFSDIEKAPTIDACEMAISALSEIKVEWIPVSERLPKAFETVLRTRVENGWNGTTYTIVDTGCICPVDHNIVAWMPLPKPYNAESEDKE